MPKRLKIADLKFDPQNARVRTAKGEAMIQESLRSVGAARSIVIDEDGTILAGNGTVEAAGQVGIENVVIVEASGDEIIAVKRVGLTDEQKKKLAYYDNRTGDEAEWDMEQVARDLLGGYEFLDELFDNIEVPAPEKEGTDELPEDPAEVLRDKWGVEYGDLWQIGPHRILCGDSTKKEDVERLLNGATPNLMVTDPPYGMAFQSNYRKNKHKKIHGDNAIPSENIRQWIARSDCAAYVFCRWDNLGEVPPPKSVLVWLKNNHSMGDLKHEHGRKWEACCFYNRENHAFTKRIPDVLDADRTGNELHPTQKPVDLIQRLIACNEGVLVADPYAGSGTTLVAAHNESRTCYAMEIDPAYVAVCIERMAQLGYDPDKVENLEG